MVQHTIEGVKYNNIMVNIDDIKICILNMEIVTRDPMKTKRQYANHINIDNVGGVNTFLRFFNERIEDLPLTCRCGKKHLGNNEICKHLIYK